MIVGYYKNRLYTTDISSALKKNNNNNKKSQYMGSHPETGSDSPIGLDRESGRDTLGQNYIRQLSKHKNSWPINRKVQRLKSHMPHNLQTIQSLSPILSHSFETLDP